jgi:hypothetical protein
MWSWVESGVTMSRVALRLIRATEVTWEGDQESWGVRWYENVGGSSSLLRSNAEGEYF